MNSDAVKQYCSDAKAKMAIRITQENEGTGAQITLRVEGLLAREGAELLARTCQDLQRQKVVRVVVNLYDVTFLDEAGAAILRRLSRLPDIAFEDCELFTRQMIERAEHEPHLL
jgi:ABC-type transporter Mla MlaB component